MRRAVAGDDASLGWLIERWTPLLPALARQRSGQVLRRVVDPHHLVPPRAAGSSVGMLQRLPGQHGGAVTRAVRRETQDVVRDAIEQLDPLDRDVVLMRGLERHPVQQIAAALGGSDNVVSQRYRRALDKLRALLPAELVGLFAAGWRSAVGAPPGSGLSDACAPCAGPVSRPACPLPTRARYAVRRPREGAPCRLA